MAQGFYYTGTEPGVRAALEYLQAWNGRDGLELILKRQPSQGLTVERAGETVLIHGSERALLFRGIGLAAERQRSGDLEDGARLAQQSRFDMNGLLADCSRNGVLRPETVKELLIQLALMGHNTLMLYTEDTYEVETQPYFGHMRGRYSREELKELDEYADMLGVELVPCIQTLAHLPCALRWPVYGDVVDCMDILLADEEKTYELVEEWIAACRRSFRSRRIHIGMDEAHFLTRGAYQDKHGPAQRFDVMCRHLKRVLDICAKYDFEPMMWNDMFFRMDAGSGYEPETGIAPELMAKVPEGVGMVYWDYYTLTQDEYDRKVAAQCSLPGELLFAGGAWKWSSYATALYHSLRVSRLALNSCVRYGINKVFVTAWGDNGGDASIFSILPVVQLFAEYGFNPQVDEATLAARFKTCTGGDWNSCKLLDSPDLPDGDDVEARRNPCKYLLFQDVLLGLFDRHVRPDYSAYYAGCAARLAGAARQNQRYAYVFETLAELCGVLELKATAGVDIKAAYDGGNLEKLRLYGEKILPEISRRMEQFLETYRTQWFRENKPFGFEVQESRIGGAAARVRSAAARVLDYAQGRLSSLEELEAPRLPYKEDRDGKSTDCNKWSLMISGGMVAGV